jgi:hypothetical protein
LIGWSYSSAFDFYFPQPRGDNFEKGTALTHLNLMCDRSN